MLLELAVAASCQAIVTHNLRDLAESGDLASTLFRQPPSLVESGY